MNKSSDNPFFSSHPKGARTKLDMTERLEKDLTAKLEYKVYYRDNAAATKNFERTNNLSTFTET